MYADKQAKSSKRTEKKGKYPFQFMINTLIYIDISR